MNKSQLNVFGKTLKTCSDDPLTGFFRDGCCNSSINDHGEHTVCAIVSDKFLKFLGVWMGALFCSNEAQKLQGKINVQDFRGLS